jgi:asparagine synthetase B (glutamine-hydrolysing)
MCSFLILPKIYYNNLNEHIKKQILQKLKLRGPDKTNILEYKNYIFIHSLLHFSGEITEQPLIDKKNDVVLCFNGEIYNYKDFGNYKSDTEMIIKEYISNKTDFIHKLDGEFTFIIFDFKKKIIIQSPDIFKIKPQFYKITNEGIIISTFRSIICKCCNLNNEYDDFDKNQPILEKDLTIHTFIKSLEPNKFIIRNLNNFDIIEKKTIYEFDLRQFKNNYNDIYLQIENSIKKRVKNNNNGNVGLCLSSGYDSGAISCYLNKINFDYTSYTIKCQENMDILKKRLKLNKKTYFYNLKSEQYFEFKKKYQESVEGTCIKEYKTHDKIFGYYNLKGEWAGVGLYYIFNESKKDNVKIFLSGQGADEIFSDYGWRGISIKNINGTNNNKNYPFSFCGNFPKDLKTIFPWPNFYKGLNECFIAKEEYTGSLFGIETRYPYLDKNVVQEFLWLNNDLKNKYYKAPIHNYLTENNYPFCPNEKFGFKVKPLKVNKINIYENWLDIKLNLLNLKFDNIINKKNYTLKKILSKNNFKICLEFGSINKFLNLISTNCQKVYSFDTYDNNTLIENFFKENPNINIDMIYIHCNLYSTTNNIFNILLKYKKIKSKLVIVFNKLINYNNFHEGPIKALYKICNNNNLNFKWLYTHGSVLNYTDILSPKYKNMSIDDFINNGFQQQVAIKIK